MTIFEIKEILECNNDIYILYRHNVVILINNIRNDKSKQDIDDLIDFYEL
jgi:hypothetical protein